MNLNLQQYGHEADLSLCGFKLKIVAACWDGNSLSDHHNNYLGVLFTLRQKNKEPNYGFRLTIEECVIKIF